MPLYKVDHITSYDYSVPVVVSQHLSHLLPRPCKGQRWLSHAIAITPEPSATQERQDLFSNRALAFLIETEHCHFSIAVTGVVEVLKKELPACALAWEEVAKAIEHPKSSGNWEASFHAYQSPLVNFDASIKQYAAQSMKPGRPLLEAAIELNSRIHKDFAYAPATTSVGTMPTEILRERRGVCQDFAHLLCACLRSYGVACRYVSGYLLTHPPEGQPKMTGVDATHAWASVYLPGAGWVDLDPTNDLVVGDEHIVLAWGRDFSDVSPLKGVITGGGPHSVKVSVNVDPVTATKEGEPGT